MLAMGLACLALATTGLAQGSLSPSDPWNVFSADLIVRRSVVTADGRPEGGHIPTMKYRVERTKTPAGWRSVFTVLWAEPMKTVQDGRETLLDHFAVARIEDDGDGSQPRVILRDGSLFPVQSPEDVAAGVRQLFEINPDAARLIFDNSSSADSSGRGRDWVESVISSQSPALRRAVVESRFGRPVAREGGFDRYVSQVGESRRDVLVEAATGLISGIDESRNGTLVGHTTIAWVVGPGNSFVRSGLHSEARMRDGRRLVADVEYARVALEARRAR
jgi:hypothetical protein